MKLLISVTDEQEAADAITGGADIIDVKNPKEGALGASFPWIIRQIKGMAPKDVEVSCALGDLPNLPGSVSLAALGGAMTGVNYIKVGIGGAKTKKDAIFLLQNAVKAVKDYCPTVKVAAAAYADAKRAGSIDPSLIPEIADEANVDVTMIDTALKDGSNLFTYLNNEQVQRIVDDSHDRGLLVALAGSLKKEQILNVSMLRADIIGLRGAACTSGDRVNGRITKEKVHELASIVKQIQMKAVAVH